MDFTGFDAPWWTSLILPLLFPLYVGMIRKIYMSERPKIRIGYEVSEHAHVNVSTLTVSTITIWNDGTEVIEGATFATQSPLRIEFDGPASIFQSEISRTSEKANNISLIASAGTEQLVEMEFMNPGDGFRWIVTHDGGEGKIRVKGAMKGARTPPVRLGYRIPAIGKLAIIFLFVGGFGDATVTLYKILTTVGFSSIEFWTWLPIPMILSTGAAFIISALLVERANKGFQLVEQWNRQDAAARKIER